MRWCLEISHLCFLFKCLVLLVALDIDDSGCGGGDALLGCRSEF